MGLVSSATSVHSISIQDCPYRTECGGICKTYFIHACQRAIAMQGTLTFAKLCTPKCHTQLLQYLLRKDRTGDLILRYESFTKSSDTDELCRCLTWWRVLSGCRGKEVLANCSPGIFLCNIWHMVSLLGSNLFDIVQTLTDDLGSISGLRSCPKNSSHDPFVAFFFCFLPAQLEYFSAMVPTL